MPRSIRFLLLALIVASGGAVTAADSIEVFQLKGRTPEELIPVIKPLVGDASLSGMGTRLIVRATPEQMAQIRELIGQLDKAPRRLLIEVSTDRSLLASNRALDVSGSARIGDVRIAGGRPVDGVEARIRESQTRSDASGRQRVQTLEGQHAFINTGQSIAVHQPTISVIGNTVVEQDRVVYRDVRRGFYVIPHLNGDQVTLRITQHDDRVGPRGHSAIDVQSAATVVRGRLGEWIELGGISGNVETDTRGLTRYRSTSREGERVLLLRVLEVE